ncbi:MAG: hypothetical protein HYR56_04355 [Acidobacteria bacterium]|nr:hypothetical protein [Acidobacteriota bacterium]MBI3421734.1 hypothetical protein [Acidobacteriota bacterium]
MGRIVVRFDGLCMFFTDNLLEAAGQNATPPSLTVGLVEVSKATKNLLPENVPVTAGDYHVPQIRINEIKFGPNKFRYWKKTWKKVAGDLSLDVYPVSPQLDLSTSDITLTKLIDNNDGSIGSPAEFHMINIEKELYPVGKVKASPKLCKARFHVSTGSLYGLKPWPGVQYGIADITGKLTAGTATKPTTISIKAGLEIAIPENGYALLYFSDGTKAFTFEGGKDYEVVVESLSKNSSKVQLDRNHFLYYYSIFEPKPKPDQLMAPIKADGAETTNDPFCSGAGG